MYLGWVWKPWRGAEHAQRHSGTAEHMGMADDSK